MFVDVLVLWFCVLFVLWVWHLLRLLVLAVCLVVFVFCFGLVELVACLFGCGCFCFDVFGVCLVDSGCVRRFGCLLFGLGLFG